MIEIIKIGLVFIGMIAFVAFIGYLVKKFFGIVTVSKYSSYSSADIKKPDNFLFDLEVEQNPIIVNYAIENVKKKMFAMTKSNVIDEIEKIKKDKPLMEIINKLNNQ